MDRIQNQKHSKLTFYYSCSRLLERTSYYSFRALVVLYMTGEILKMERTEAFEILGLFIASLTFSQIIGALLGDLILGNRKAIIIGGVIQAFGAFSLCIPSSFGLYLGLFLVVLGNGLYSPNFISNFGKLYLGRTKLLDSVFTLLYLVVNLGSFLGVTIIGFFGEKYGFNIGFVSSGILMLVATILISLSKPISIIETIKNIGSLKKRIITISIAILIVGIFWEIYGISTFRISSIQLEFSNISSLNIPKSLWHSFNAIFIVLIGIIATIAWSYFYSSQFFKLMVGFVFGAISFGILFLIPEIPSEQDIPLYFLVLLFLGISEIHIAPIIYSILTKYSNPKYLAISISLLAIPTMLLSVVFGLFNYKFYENPTLGLVFGIVAMSAISIVLLAFILCNKKANYSIQE